MKLPSIHYIKTELKKMKEIIKILKGRIKKKPVLILPLVVVVCVIGLVIGLSNNKPNEEGTIQSEGSEMTENDTPVVEIEDGNSSDDGSNNESTSKPQDSESEQATQSPTNGNGETTEKPSDSSSNSQETPTEQPSKPEETPIEKPTETPTKPEGIPTEQPSKPEEIPTETPSEQPSEEPSEEPIDPDKPIELPIVPAL